MSLHDDYPDMPFLQNIGLLITYKCQVACPHCILEAGPHRTEEMSLSDAIDWIRQIADYRQGHIKVISLTGGEPFIDLDRLKVIAAFGRQHGLLMTAVTNAFWAATPEDAVKTLCRVPELSMIAISSDVYHQSCIPFERVRNAIMAAKACNIPYSVSVCTEGKDDPGYLSLMGRLQEITDTASISTTFTQPAGRAARSPGASSNGLSRELPAGACQVSASPVIFPDGRVIACIGPLINLKSRHPMELGNLNSRPLAEILDDAENNPVLHELRIMGPARIAAMVREAGLGDHLPEFYQKDNICELCYSMMADETVVRYLESLARDPGYLRKIAYSRVYYLNETRMAEDYEKRQMKATTPL